MSDHKKKNGLIMQAGILATAGIVVRIIGLLYNRPLVQIIGDEGFGYYDSAFAAYSIVLLISSYSIPSAVSKVIAGKLARREYKNAQRVFVCALIYAVVIGLAACAFVFFGARILVKMESAVLPLKVLAPTVFVSGILGVFRGYFQAQRTMVPTSISQIIEQIFNAVFSVWMAHVLTQRALLTDPGRAASYGAAGSTIGTGAGVLSALLFMVAIYFMSRSTVKRRIAEDTHTVTDSYANIFATIFMVVTPFILSTGVYNLNNFLDKTIYQVICMDAKQMTEPDVARNLSAMAKAVKISNIPIAMASAMASTLIPTLAAHLAVGDREDARETVTRATRITMYIAIPSAVGVGVLSRPILRLIFPQKESLPLAGAMLSLIAVTVALYGLSTLTQAVLQSAGKMNLPILNAALSILLHTVFMVVMMLLLPAGASLYIYGIATILYAFFLCVFNGLSVRKYLNYHQEIDKTFLRPLFSSVVMGAVAFGVYQGMFLLVGSNMLALLVAVIFAVLIYFVLTVKWQAVSEEDLLTLPKGHLIVAVARKMRLF